MAKFKIGDRVRRVSEATEWSPIGYETDVLCDYTFVGADGVNGYTVIDHKWELAQPATPSVSNPIRTVTYREIVPGEYCNGKIEIFDDGCAVVRNWTDSSVAREAARIFNEIADVMDENEKKEAA